VEGVGLTALSCNSVPACTFCSNLSGWRLAIFWMAAKAITCGICREPLKKQWSDDEQEFSEKNGV
jgi:hypothetical protein